MAVPTVERTRPSLYSTPAGPFDAAGFFATLGR